MERQTRRAGLLAMAAAAFLWSIAGLFIKIIDWHPLTIAGIRSSIAGLVILLYLKRPRLHWSFPQVAAALSYTATMLLFVSANKLTTSSNAIILQYIAPIATAFLGAWMLKERARIEHWVAFLFVGAGIMLMFKDTAGSGRLAGDILAILCAFTFSLTFIFMRMQKEGSPLESMLLSHAATAAIGLAASIFLPAPRLTAGALASVAALGIFQVGLAAMLFSYAIKRVSAVTANLVAVIEPVFNPIWVFLALGEAPGPKALIGGVIIVVAVTAASAINAGRAAVPRPQSAAP